MIPPHFFFFQNLLSSLGPKMIDETTRWSQCHPVNQSLYDFQANFHYIYSSFQYFRWRLSKASSLIFHSTRDKSCWSSMWPRSVVSHSFIFPSMDTTLVSGTSYSRIDFTMALLCCYKETETTRHMTQQGSINCLQPTPNNTRTSTLWLSRTWTADSLSSPSLAINSTFR